MYYISHNIYFIGYISYIFAVQSHSCVWLFVTPWMAACQDSLSFTLSRCHPTISSVAPFSSYLQSFSASGCFPMNWLFASGGQNIGAPASASVLPVNIQGWFLLGLTGFISLLSKGLSRVFSSTTVGKYQFFGSQPYYTYIQIHIYVKYIYTHTYLAIHVHIYGLSWWLRW